MLYTTGTEVMPLSKHLLNMLDSFFNCVSQAAAKIFNAYDKDSINQSRLVYILPDVSVMVERLRIQIHE